VTEPPPSPWRTLNACATCARQYDVSHLVRGARVRCTCGATFAASFKEPHHPRHVRCSGCGGNLELGARACPYCAAEVTLEEKRLTSICPSCCARLLERASYCMECGIAIQPQALYALPEQAACPRCAGKLRGRELADQPLVECGSCGGLWLTEQRFETFCATQEAREKVSVALGVLSPPGTVDGTEQVRYLPCVVCRDFMTRRNFAAVSGVILDVCRKHGVWLDHSELEKVLAFIRAGGLDRSRRLEIERLDRARTRLESDKPVISEPVLRDGWGGRPPAESLVAWVLERVIGL
jgi:Zn-finger nucleic acid-binding protein